MTPITISSIDKAVVKIVKVVKIGQFCPMLCNTFSKKEIKNPGLTRLKANFMFMTIFGRDHLICPKFL